MSVAGRHDVEVAEYTDPACSWAWGSEPKSTLGATPSQRPADHEPNPPG